MFSNPVIAYCAAIAAGYLLGSINFAVIVSRIFMGKDVRSIGSGNAGSTNMLRNFGWLPALCTFAGDLLKGFAAVVLGRMFLSGICPYGGFLGGFAAMAGHTWPVFFGFKGGKGVATALGVVLAVEPLSFFVISLIGFPIAGISGYVSLGSITSGILYPVCLSLIRLWQGRFDPIESLISCVIAVVLVFNHRSNIKRLLNGTEKRFSPKRQKS